MSYNDNRDSGGVVISNDVIASNCRKRVKDVDGFGSFRAARGFIVTGTFIGIASRG